MTKIAMAEFTQSDLCLITGALYKAYTNYKAAGLGREVVGEYKRLHEAFCAAWRLADDEATEEEHA